MAPDSERESASSLIAGIFWFGLIAVNSGENCSPLARLTLTIS